MQISSEHPDDLIRDAYNRIVLIAAAARSSEGSEQYVVDAIAALAEEAVVALQSIIDADGHEDEPARGRQARQIAKDRAK